MLMLVVLIAVLAWFLWFILSQCDKVERDRMMNAYDKEYPEYGFAQHKGYGTAQHIEALEKYGPCPIHRRSFEPVKSLVQR